MGNEKWETRKWGNEEMGKWNGNAQVAGLVARATRDYEAVKSGGRPIEGKQEA